jgi:LTXXQ motif.
MRRKLFIFALAAICLVFASGVAVGVVGRRAFHSNNSQSVLVEELDLTPEQRQKIQRIWSEWRHHTPVPMEEIEKADAERWQH